MNTSTVQLYVRGCSSCGRQTVTSSLCLRPDLCPSCFGEWAAGQLEPLEPSS